MVHVVHHAVASVPESVKNATEHSTSLERVANGHVFTYRMEEMTLGKGCGVINIASEKTN